jgi:hypothetical protein
LWDCMAAEYPTDKYGLIFSFYRSQKMRVRFQRNYKHLLELALGLKARSDDSTHLMIQIVKYAALDPAKKLHPRTGGSHHHLPRHSSHCIFRQCSTYSQDLLLLWAANHRAQPCNVVLHDINTVEAAYIAYGCVQVSFHYHHL